MIYSYALCFITNNRVPGGIEPETYIFELFETNHIVIDNYSTEPNGHYILSRDYYLHILQIHEISFRIAISRDSASFPLLVAPAPQHILTYAVKTMRHRSATNNVL